MTGDGRLLPVRFSSRNQPCRFQADQRGGDDPNGDKWWKAAIAYMCEFADPRLMVRLKPFWCGSLTVLLSGCSAVDERYPLSKPTCAIALGYLKKFQAEAGRPIAVMVRNTDLAPSRDEIAALLKQQPQLKRHPDVAQALAEADVRKASVVQRCPEIRKWLSAEKILHNDGRIKKLMRTDDWPVAVLSISAPVLTKAGDRATFYVSRYWAPLGGGVHAVRYRRDSEGRWRFETEHAVEIS